MLTTTPAPTTTVQHVTTVAWEAAGEPGALDAWVMTCTCGSRLGNSLSERWARNDEREHQAYWAARQTEEVGA